MTDKELFLCPSCAINALRLRPELDAGIVELDGNNHCPLCGSDAVVSVHRLGKQVSPVCAPALSNSMTAIPLKLKPRNDLLNFLIQNCPEAAVWWDGWHQVVDDCWLFDGRDTVEIQLQNQDGSQAVVVLPVRVDLLTWTKTPKETS